MSDRLVALDLHQTPSAAVESQFERLLDLLLQALPDPDDGSGRESLQGRIDDYKQALAQADPGHLRVSGDALVSACRGAAEQHTRLRAIRRAEMADLLTMIREVTVAIAGEATTAAGEASAAAARFAALGEIRDLRLLKDQLAVEITGLRDRASERERRWQSTVASFAQQIQRLEGQLVITQQEATHDSLTGLANRRLFDRRLADLVQERSGPFAVVMVDVDGLKRINDDAGHETGDRVLRTIARSLATSVRSQDMVARISGDEFAVILEHLSLALAASRVAALAAAIGPALEVAGLPNTSISCGLAEWSPGDTVSALVKRADDALYESKHQGRGRVTRNPET